MTKLHFATAAFAALVAVVPSNARANGRFPSANQLVAAPTDPTLMVLRTTFGVLLSHDAGQSWDWICEKAIGYGGVQDPPLGLTTQKSIVAGMFEGLGVSSDTGCSWSFVQGELAKKPVVDIVVHPDNPHAILALTNQYGGATDAGDPLFTSQVFLSTDDGAHWAKAGTPVDPTYILETIEVAATDPHRIYVSGVTGSGTTSSGALFVSTDDGTTWQKRAVPIDPATERAPFIAGVDPTNADRVYVRTNGTQGSRLLVSADAGQNYATVYSSAVLDAGATALLGFAQSADGSKVYVGGPQDGLLVASRADMKFSQKSTIAVQCLAVIGATLYACANEASGFILGSSTNDGSSFTPVLHLSHGIRGPLACPSGSSEDACIDLWPPLREQLGITPDVDGGADASSDATSDAGPAQGGSKGCGSCATAARSRGDLDSLAAFLLGGTLFAMRRSRRDRTTPRIP